MGQLLKYSGITTKIRAMTGNLLSRDDYKKIAELTSINEFLHFLQEQPAYEALFSSLEKNLTHRDEIEKLITKSLFNDFQRIFCFSGLKQRKFLKLYYKRYEIDLIKYLLRTIWGGTHHPFYISTRRDFFQKYSSLDINLLAESESLEQLLENLSGTEYYKILVRINHQTSSLFDYELALDLYFFSLLWKEKNKILSGKEMEVITKIYGTDIDLLNIQWVYRTKKYYNMTPSEIYAMSIPIHYKLKKQDFMALAEASSPEEILSILRNTYYGKYESMVTGDLEDTYTRILDVLYQGDMQKNPYSMASINTYLYRKEREINNLTSLLECIRYGLNPAETLHSIGGT